MSAIRYKPIVRMYLGGDWRDITSDVRVTEPMSIKYGARDESTKLNPGTCEFKINDPNGDYSPHDPMGRWHGTFDRNTRVELLREWFTDYFDRTVSGGLGSTPAGEEWTGYFGVGGAVLLSDFNVTGHYATMSVPTTSAYRSAYLPERYRDVEVMADVTLLENPDGGDLEPGNILLRRQSDTSYYMVRVVIPAAASVPTVTFHHSTAGQLATPVSTGFTYNHAVPLRIRAQAEGQTLRVKVWQADGVEPKNWQMRLHDDRITAAGNVGIRNGVGAGNTDAKPVVFRINRFVVSSPRMTGEVSDLKAGVDSVIISSTGQTRIVRWTKVTVSGIIRRLSQGSSPRQSPLRRKIASLSSLVSYWPCEDPKTAVAPAGHGNTLPIMTSFWIPGVSLGRAKMSSYGGFFGSDDVPEPSGAIWIGPVSGYTHTGTIETQMVAQIPEDSTDGSVVLTVETTGTKELYVVDWRAGGSMSVTTYPPGGAGPTTFGPYGFNLGSSKFKMQFIVKQVGANVVFNLSVLFELDDTGASLSGSTGDITATAGTLGRCTNVVANGSGMLKRGALGHLFVRSVDSGSFSFLNEFSGFHTERALTRFLRIGSEESLPVAYWGAEADTVQMGYQDKDTALGHFQDIANTDMGLMTETRGAFGLHYRSRVSLYRQTPGVSLNLVGQIRPGFQPDYDDKYTRNDITAKRAMSGDFRITRATGPLSSADPPDGVGRYDDAPTLNPAKLTSIGGGAQTRDGVLPDLAGWRLALGTVPEPRFPAFAVDMSGLPAATERALFDLMSGDRLDVTGAASLGVYGTIRQVVRGYSETFTNHSWVMRLITAPYAPYDVGSLDEAPTSSAARLNPTIAPVIRAGSNPPEGISTTVTSFVIDTWSETWATTATHPGAFPFSAMLGGEEITVTAMTTAFVSIYTVTCVRSVNGVVKSHTIGTQLTLKRPLRLSL